MRRSLLLMTLLAGAAVSHASITMATFSDPAPNSGSPLFDWDMGNNNISASWAGNGLSLQTPGFTGGGFVNNAHFVMNPVSITPIINNVLYQMGSGTVDFYTTNVNNPFFTITFSGGTFLNPFNAGASEISGNVVNFLGANVPGGLFDRQFSFSLANPVVNGTHATYTASFTSSADIVPEPATMLALVAGIAAFARKRRS